MGFELNRIHARPNRLFVVVQVPEADAPLVVVRGFGWLEPNALVKTIDRTLVIFQVKVSMPSIEESIGVAIAVGDGLVVGSDRFTVFSHLGVGQPFPQVSSGVFEVERLSSLQIAQGQFFFPHLVEANRPSKNKPRPSRDSDRSLR